MNLSCVRNKKGDMRKFVGCLAALSILVSCGNQEETSDRKDGYSQAPQTAEDSLFEEVMHGHDTAMAKMGKLGRYQKQVDAKIDSLKKLGGSKWAELEKSLGTLGAELKDAQEGMNRWMDEFEIDSAQEDMKRRIDYLRSEKIKVDDVKEKIFHTLEKADSLLSR